MTFVVIRPSYRSRMCNSKETIFIVLASKKQKSSYLVIIGLERKKTKRILLQFHLLLLNYDQRERHFSQYLLILNTV